LMNLKEAIWAKISFAIWTLLWVRWLFQSDDSFTIFLWTQFFRYVTLSRVKVVDLFVNSSLTFWQTFIKLWIGVQKRCAWVLRTGYPFEHVNFKLCVAFGTLFTKDMSTRESLNHILVIELAFTDWTAESMSGFLFLWRSLGRLALI
jgi:hypothetical protein